MPNWVKNVVTASPEVISAMVNEQGRVDFNMVIPCNLVHEIDFVSFDDETYARVLAIALTEVDSEERVALVHFWMTDVDSIPVQPDSPYVDTVISLRMLENFLVTGYYSWYDFSRNAWGCKWNASNCMVDIDRGTCTFNTPWSTPDEVYTALANRFPNETIQVKWADEDIGYNCGTLVLQEPDNFTVESDCTLQDTEYWKMFAMNLWGYEEDAMA